MSPYPARMSDHWWWRPGVRPGRRLLVWHILLHDQPELRALVRQCQDKLDGLDGLDLIPEEWLHMTTQIVGFADEIRAAEVDTMVDEAAKRLGALEPIEVELGRLWFHSEAVMLGVRPSRALHPVREAIREAVAASVHVHQLDDDPEWTPHVSVAYSHADRPAEPVVSALALRPAPRPLRVSEVHLVEQVREGRLYRWDVRAEVPLAA
ncbi:2'-5' RNA ligase family protein [Spirillospora sp. NPDC029432]|uniref:2'-5' RNA ligase family protein n=1 Tax=Spirillospora sp. NPDC029432 TaxID=3154599 RepID=UPI003455FC07